MSQDEMKMLPVPTLIAMSSTFRNLLIAANCKLILASWVGRVNDQMLKCCKSGISGKYDRSASSLWKVPFVNQCDS